MRLKNLYLHYKIDKLLLTDSILSLKIDYNGYILRYKVRWVVYNLKQEEKIHLVKTFTTVVKSILYKCLFKVNVKQKYKIWQMDIVITILYSFFNKIIYVKWFYLFNFSSELVYWLYKALYELQ